MGNIAIAIIEWQSQGFCLIFTAKKSLFHISMCFFESSLIGLGLREGRLTGVYFSDQFKNIE